MYLVVILALGAAFCNALSSVLQKQSSKQTTPDETLRPSLIVDLVHRPAYLAGIGALIASFLLQAGALDHGRLSTVQPILAAELLFLLGILVVWFHRKVGMQEWLGAGGIVVGVGGFLAVAAPSGGRATASPLGWGLTGGAVVLTLVVLLAAGRATGGSRRAALFGAAAAVAFSVTAALVKVSVHTLTGAGLEPLFASWRPYALALVGAAAVFLSSNAFQRGSVAAAQAALSGVDPLVSIALGVGVFRERLHGGGLAITFEVLALALMLAGIVVLSRSPLVSGASSSEGNQPGSGEPAAGGPGLSARARPVPPRDHR